MLKKVLIIANPASGKNKAEEYAIKLSTLLEKTHQSETEIRLTKKAGDAIKWAENAYEEQFDSVICLGGDGTVNETVQGIIKNKNRPFFAFVPLGTVNDLGRAIGYSLHPEEAIEQFKNVDTTKMDVAVVNNQIFINVLAIGEIPNSVMQTESSEKNKLGVFAYIKDAIGALFGDKGIHVKITCDDVYEEINTNLIICALTNSVGGYEAMVPKAQINDGMLHLLAVKGNKPLDLIKAIIDGIITEDETENLLILTGKNFKIELAEPKSARKKILSNIDGDQGPALPLEISVIPSAIQIIIPQEK